MAKNQLDDILFYLTYVLKNEQAAKSVWNDAMDTIDMFETVAGSLRVYHRLQDYKNLK